jgi:hypothetical protein
VSPDDSPTEDLTPVAPGPPRQVEAKLVVVTVLAPILYTVLDTVQANTVVLDGLPPWARTLVLAVLPSLLALLAGYRVPSNRV